METINVDSVKDTRAFGYHFNGYIKVPADGLYGFSLKSNDGAKFYLDDNLIIDNDGAHRAQESLVKVGLKKGYHSIKLDYFQQGRAKSLVLRWEGPGIENQEIPGSALFHKK